MIRRASSKIDVLKRGSLPSIRVDTDAGRYYEELHPEVHTIKTRQGHRVYVLCPACWHALVSTDKDTLVCQRCEYKSKPLLTKEQPLPESLTCEYFELG